MFVLFLLFVLLMLFNLLCFVFRLVVLFAMFFVSAELYSPAGQSRFPQMKFEREHLVLDWFLINYWIVACE